MMRMRTKMSVDDESLNLTMTVFLRVLFRHFLHFALAKAPMIDAFWVIRV